MTQNGTALAARACEPQRRALMGRTALCGALAGLIRQMLTLLWERALEA